MKTPVVPLLAFTLLATVGLRAEMANASATPSVAPGQGNLPPPHQVPGGPGVPQDPRVPQGGSMANLTETERQQLKAANDKAIAQNPSLGDAMKAARQAMEKARNDLHQAIITADPSMAAILAKITPPKREGNQVSDGQPGGHGPRGWMADIAGRHAPPGLANLTEDERRQLKATRDQVKNDPAVVSAHEAMKSASTPEARRYAGEALRQAFDSAMLKADPALGPVLEKLHQTPPPPPPTQGSSPQEGASGMMQQPAQ